MPLFRRWPANRGTPASNRWSPFPVDGAYGRESAMGAKHGRCVLSPATGCDGCGAKAASARSTNRFAKIHATANRHQRAEVQRFYRRHDDNHHIRQYASDTVDRYKIEPANPQVVYVPNYNPATVYGARPIPLIRRCIYRPSGAAVCRQFC